MLKNYLKIALRNMGRQKGYALINIAGLAIGIACCFLIVLYVLDELSYDRHFPNAEQIYRVVVHGTVGNQEISSATTAAPMGESLVSEYPEVVHATRLNYNSNMLVRYQEKVFNETGFFWVDSNFFDIFDIPMRHGDPRTALQDDHTLVLTETVAAKYFDQPAEAIGKIVTFEDGTPYTVTGIIADPLPNTHFQYGMLSPLSSWGQENIGSFWLNHFMYTYIMLRPGASPAALEAKFPGFIRKYVAPQIQDVLGMTLEEMNASGNRISYHLQPLTDIHLHSHFKDELMPNSDIKYIYIFSLVALFILLIACINFMNLSTARSAGRSREVGLRKVFGAPRNQLIMQFLLESILLTLIALAVALVLLQLLLPHFNHITGKQLSSSYLANWYLIPSAIALAVAVGILAGSYPAFFLSAFRPVAVLKGRLNLGIRSTALRSALVVFQFAISIFLFVSTLIVYQQLQYVQDKRLGFDKENVVVIKRGWAIGQNPDGTQQEAVNNQSVIDVFKHELMKNPNIIAAAGANSLPGEGINNSVFVPEGAPRGEQHPMNFFFADYDLMETLQLKLVEGRFFSREMASDSFAVVINETAARTLGLEPPYSGKRIGFPGNDRFFLHIVGVLEDFHYQSLHRKVEPLIIALNNIERAYLAVRIRPQNVPETVAYIEKTWASFIPYKPFEYFFLDDNYDALYRAEQRTGQLFTRFSLLAIFIACLGLFGLASFTTEQRTRESGIRKVLGASVPAIIFKLSREFTRWVLLANLIAWPLAWLAMRAWLEDFAYRITIGPAPFIAAGLIALVIALLTISYQAIKAALTNPADALRYE